MGILSSLFRGSKIDLKELVKQGAVIVDVRTPGEYAGGHIKGSLNIPLQNLDKNLGKLSKDKTIITCCASGMRSGSAKSMLKAKGYEVHNGGGWASLQSKIR
jgi:rhodanese-related sulfurtransferase